MTSSPVCAPASTLLLCLGLLGSRAQALPPDAGTHVHDVHDAGTHVHDAGAHDAGARPVDMTTLLKAFSSMPGLEATFVEEKHIALLAKPLESKGHLYFTHPGLLLRRVDSPRPSTVVITPDSLRTSDEHGEQTMDLRARNDLRPFVESLTWILGGDQKSLAAVYTLTFTPELRGAPWQLTLTPKTKPLSQLIAELRIAGRGLNVATVEVRETSGDSAVTRIVSADPYRTFDAKERAALFGVPKAP